ncbi:MAG: flippase-like domain-containing protein [Anaerolineales bacterium]|nr:flippase-like domain-containing protein [Anaerolineales bacterium]
MPDNQQPPSSKTLFVSALVFILLIGLLAYFIDWNTVAQQLQGIQRVNLAAASLALVVGFLAYAVRWRLLLDDKPGFIPTFHAANVASMANTLIPVRPGDALRIFILGKNERLPLLEVTSSIVVERWLEQIMRLAAFGGAVIFGAGGAVSTSTILGSVTFLGMALILMVWMVKQRQFVLARLPTWLARLPRLTEARARKALGDLIDGLESIASVRRLALALLWSLIAWSFFWGFHYLCLLALAADIDLNTRLALSLGSLALVPPSATTVPGVYQVSMVAPLALIGYDENTLTSYSLVMNLAEMAWIVGLGAWGALSSGVSLRQVFSRDAV